MGFKERDVFKLVPALCGYRRLVVATGLLHCFESRLLDQVDVLSNQITPSFILVLAVAQQCSSQPAHQRFAS